MRLRLKRWLFSLAVLCLGFWMRTGLAAEESPALLGSGSETAVRLATFDVDATPPIGSLLAYDPMTNRWDLGLRARGVVLFGAGDPIVLCAIDWIGIGNASQDFFRKALADAAGTTASRVAVHTLHQHDAPECDFSAEQLLRDSGQSTRQYEGAWQRQFVSELASAVRQAIPRARLITHLGLGQAPVEKVASNRRIPGPDGKIRAVRWTATPDPKIRAEPEGLIDPAVSLVSFWQSNRPVAVLSYYATHPQSYYRTGIANPDFPGVARFLRQLAVPECLHVHFNGAGGNIGAGKYNDGSPETRRVLAERLAEGMRRAWDNTKRQPLRSADVKWSVESIALAPSTYLVRDTLEAQLKAQDATFLAQGGPTRLAWVRRCQEGHAIDLACLSLGRARILHLPGEPFVEYQLGAKQVRSDLFVAVAGYGDYAPWYIGTARAYDEGGYETGPTASNVGPEAETILNSAIKKLLGGAR